MIAQLNRPSDWISYEDFLSTVPDGTRAEWVDGEIVYMTPQTDRHLLISGFLYTAISGYLEFKQSGGLVAQAGFQVKLGRSGREPDVFYLAPEHMHRFRRTFVDGPVDLAVEVISPESRVRDRGDKFREYAQGGVREYWIIDPDAETVDVYRLSDSNEYELVPLGDPPRVTSQVIPGFWLNPEWMWANRPSAVAAYREWGLI